MNKRQWAEFIVDKLGLPFTKKAVMSFADGLPDEYVWDWFIASHEEYLNVAKANKIESVFDVYSYYEGRGYADMRSTFPRNSNGRSIIGPRILSRQMLKEMEQSQKDELAKYRVKLSEAPKPSLIGKIIFHSANNGVSFGRGEITAIDEDKFTITVQFDDGALRVLRYKYCIDNGFIRFE